MAKSMDDSFRVSDEVLVCVEKDDLYFFDKSEKRVRQEDVEDFEKYYLSARGN